MTFARSHERGYTLVEVVIGAALASALMVIIGLVLVRGRRITTESITLVDVDAELRTVLTRLADEIRCASRTAEDANANATLDTGEDTNGNGRFEKDWLVTASSIRFNRLGSDGKYSLPITYALSGTKLERTTMLTAAGKTMVTKVASNVKAFAVTDANGTVTITLQIQKKSESGRTVDRTSSVTVAPRN